MMLCALDRLISAGAIQSGKLNFRRIAFVTFMLCSVRFPAYSHPVVFQGGTAVSGHHLGEKAEVEVVHSPTWWSGLGVSSERTPHSTQLLAKATVLVWRGHFPDLQSNFYLGTAAGKKWNSHSGKDSENPAIYMISTEWDAEDRMYYGRVRYNLNFESNKRDSSILTRIGLAPYKATSEEPAIWGMVEWMAHPKHSTQEIEHDVTPLIRFFYRNALFEVGTSFNGKVAFNYMFHFF